MFDTDDQKLESNLRLLREAITPSRDLSRRVQSVTRAGTGRYSLHMSKQFRFFLPLAAALILVVAALGFRSKEEATPGNPATDSAAIEVSSDEIINDIVNEALADQSIADEADGDIALINNDSAALDSFAASYNADEY